MPNPITTPEALDHSVAAYFEQVSPDYQHRPKRVRPAPALVTDQVYLKWYLIDPDAWPISAAQLAEAQAFVRDEIHAGRLALKHEVGFVVLHRCAEVLIIYACTWRGNNEVWETLFHKPLIPGGVYQVLHREDTSPTFCVWVLPVVLHEQQAWTRYLQSRRDPAAQAAYLADQLTGEV